VINYQIKVGHIKKKCYYFRGFKNFLWGLIMKKNIAFAFSLLGTISSSGLFASSASEGKENAEDWQVVSSVKREGLEKKEDLLAHFRQQVGTARSLLEKRPEQFKALLCIDQVREAWEETHFDLDQLFVWDDPVERIGYIFNRLRNPVSPEIFEVLRYFAFPDPTETLLKVLSLLADSRLGLDALYQVMPEKLDLEGEMCGLPVNPAARWAHISNFYTNQMKGEFTRCAVTMSMESHKASIIYKALAATNLSETLAAAGLETTILKILKSPERENQRKGITLLLRRLLDASEIQGSGRFFEVLCLNEYGFSLVKEAIGDLALQLKGVDWQSILQKLGIKTSVEDAVFMAEQEAKRKLEFKQLLKTMMRPLEDDARRSDFTFARNVPTTSVVAQALAFIDPTEGFILRMLGSSKREDQRQGMGSLLTRLVSAGSTPVKRGAEFLKMLCLNEDGLLLVKEAIEGLAPPLRDRNWQSILQEMGIREENAAKQSAGEGVPMAEEAAEGSDEEVKEPYVEPNERGVRDTATRNDDSALVRGLQESLNSAAAEEAKNLNKVLKTSKVTAADEERVRRFKEKHGSGTHSADAMAQRDWRIAIGDDELDEWKGVDDDGPAEEEHGPAEEDWKQDEEVD
jgi:hypothetical protein